MDKETGLVKVNCEIVPRRLDVKHCYSPEQRQQITEMMKVYGNLVFYAGIVTGFGSELDAPDVGALEVILEVKRQADLLPS